MVIYGAGFYSVSGMQCGGMGVPWWSGGTWDTQISFNTPTRSQVASYATNCYIWQNYGDTSTYFAYYPDPPALGSVDYTTFWCSGGTVTLRGNWFDLVGANVNGGGQTIVGRQGGIGGYLQVNVPAIGQQAPVGVPVYVYNESGNFTTWITYYPNPPTISSISPTVIDQSGGSENAVTINGTYLSTITNVSFGSQAATIQSQSATQIVAIPAGVISTNEANTTLTIWEPGYNYPSNTATTTFAWKNNDAYSADFLSFAF